MSDMLNLVVNAVVRGVEVEAVAEKDGTFLLNPLHQAITGEGVDGSQSPRRWKALPRFKELVAVMNEKNQTTDFLSFKSRRGNGGGLYVCEAMLHEYFRYLDPSYHHSMLESFTAAVAGDAVGAILAAQSVAVRAESVAVRNKTTAAWKAAGANGWDYQWATDLGYVVSHGKKATDIRKEKGLPPKSNIRVHSTDEELKNSMVWEIATQKALSSKPEDVGFRSQMVKAATVVQNFFETLTNL